MTKTDIAILFGASSMIVGLIVGVASTNQYVPAPPPVPIKVQSSTNFVSVGRVGFTNRFDGTNALITGVRLVTADEWAANALVFSNRLCLIIDGKVKAFAINPSEWGAILNDKRLSKANFTNMNVRVQLP